MISNTRDSMLSHENKEYIEQRPDWVFGKIPDLSDYRKLSVDNFNEAFTLARLGQEMASGVLPNIHGKPLRLTFTQALIVGAAVIDRPHAEQLGLDFEKYRSVLMVTPSRYGKGYAYNTPVITPNGWKKHGELQPGDTVFHPSGKQIQVVGKSDNFKCVYRVELSNGESFETSAEHEWYVWNRSYKKLSPRPNRKVLQYGRYEVLETQEMVDMGYSDGGRPKFLVDPPSPLDFNEQEQPLDPYFVGCWLGDGTSKTTAITMSDEKATDILPHLPYSPTSVNKQTGCSRYLFSNQNIIEKIRDINLFGNKHIPDIYKYASKKQQQALLAGIIDTDGYIDKTGRVIISCANARLAKDIMELLTIMGCCPYDTVVKATTSSSGIVGKKDVHQIGFQPSYELPTHYKKFTRLVPHRKIGITKIEKIEDGETGNCIQVSSPDGLYLVGETLVPTHNSFLNAIACIIMAGGAGKEVNIGGATKDKSGIIQNKIVQLLPDTIGPIQNGLVVSEEDGSINKKIQRLATQTSKESLMWQNGGSIKLFSTNEGNKSADVQAAGAIGIGGDYCVDGNCEVLTESGWIRFSDLADGVKVAQYTENGEIEFVVPSRVIRKHYTGKLYKVRFSGAKDSIYMIPEHRQPLLNKKGELKIREIKDVNFNAYWSAIQAGKNNGDGELSPLDRIVIACQADGCILKTTDKGNYYQVKFKKANKANRLQSLFEKADMDVKIHQDKRGYYVCHFYMPHSCDKVLPHWFGWDIPYKKCVQIIDEIKRWDGYTYPDGTIYYSSIVKENTDWVQAVACQCGYRSTTSVRRDNRKSTYNAVYRIHLTDSPTRSTEYATKELVDYDDMVYCVTVPSGMFMIRNINLTICTGNCVFDEIQLMSPVGFRTASRFMMEGPDTKRFCVGNPQINGHFKDVYDDPGTFVIHINDITAIVEKRMTRRGFELTDIPTYSNEYRAFIQVEFPDEHSGTRFFTTLPEVYDEARHEPAYSKMYFMGIDSAYQGADGITVTILSLNQNGSDKWVVVEKQWDVKQGITKWEAGTTMDVALEILKAWDKYNVIAGCIDIGFGIHIYEKMMELYPELSLIPINFASKPTDERLETDYNAKYALNKRAEMHLDMKDLCETHMIEINNECYDDIIRQMREVGNTPEMNKVKIEPKKKIRERLGRSPDNLDSACLAVHAMVLSGAVSGQREFSDESLMEFID